MTRLSIAVCLFGAVALTGCSKNTASTEKSYALKGTIVSVSAADRKITINHEDIPGIMPAMTMPFNFEDAKVIAGLAAGDVVEGKIKVVDGVYFVTELRKTGTAVIPPKPKDDHEAAIKANLARLDPDDRKLAEAQKFCPIADDRIGEPGMIPVKMTLKGETFFLCCASCQPSAEKDPDGTLKKIAELKKK